MTTRWHRALVALAVLPWAGCGDPAAVEGRTLDEWRRQLGSDQLPARIAALERISRFGADADAAVDDIVGRLRAAATSRERAAASRALATIATPTARDAVASVLERPDTPPLAFAAAAATAAALLPPERLGGLLDAARPTQLAGILIADSAFDAVFPPGERRQGALLWLADHGDELDKRTRYAVVRRLGALGPAGEPAVPFVASALAGDTDTDACLDTLARIGTDGAASVVSTYLTEASPANRAARLPAIGEFLGAGGPAATTARTALHRWLSPETDLETRRAACRALGDAGDAADLPALAAHLDDTALAFDARDATAALANRGAVATSAVFEVWRTTAATTADPDRARNLARAHVNLNLDPAGAATSLTRLTEERPELVSATLDALADLIRTDPRAAFVAAAEILAAREAGDDTARRWERRLASEDTPTDVLALLLADDDSPFRTTAARRLATVAPDRARIDVTVGERTWRARLVLDVTTAAIAAGPTARIHVLSRSVDEPNRTDAPGESVVWLDADGRRVDAAAAHFALTAPEGASIPPTATIRTDLELLEALR